MDIKNIKDKLQIFADKYKYVFIVILAGVLLMLLPERKTDSSGDLRQENEQPIVSQSVEQRLTQVLSRVDGAGQVAVMITTAAGEEVIYQTDTDTTVGENTNTIQSDTVTVTDTQRDQTGLVRQVNPPIYQGAIIVCEGADSPSVRFAIVEAVSKITGLGADRISVMKMK